MQEGTKLVCRKTLIHINKGKAYRRQGKAPKRRKNISVRRVPVWSFLCVRRPFCCPHAIFLRTFPRLGTDIKFVPPFIVRLITLPCWTFFKNVIITKNNYLPICPWEFCGKTRIEASRTVPWSLSGYKGIKLTTKPFTGVHFPAFSSRCIY